MKTKMSNVWIAIQAVAAICMVGAVKLWAPVCDKLLELVSGREVPMKCHWAGQAATGIAVIILAIAVIALFVKRGYKGLMTANIVAGVVLFLVFTNTLIGVCASETMRCQITALWGKVIAVVVIASSVIGLLGGKDGQVPD